MKNHTLSHLFLFLFFCPSQSYAISDTQQQNIINQQNSIIQNQQQSERDNERKREFKRIKKEQKRIELEKQQDLTKNDGKIVHDLSQIQCFRIHTIAFSQNTILSKWKEKSLTKAYLDQCLTLDQMADIAKEIANYLVQKGYATSRVNIPAQNLSGGILTIEIIESYLEKISLNEDGFFDKTQKFTAFGLMGHGKKHDILDLHQIELGVQQINRLPSNNAAVKLIPGTQPNSSIVDIENHPKGTSRVNIFYDNNGNKITGSRRETLYFSQDNLLHLNDSLVVSRTANDSDKNRDEGRSSSFSSSFSLPFKQHNLTIGYLLSSYFFITGDDQQKVRVHGKTSTKTVRLDSVLASNQDYKISSNFDLASRYNRNFSNDVKQDISSRKATILSASLSNSFYLNNGTIFLKPTYSRTINILNSQKDPASISNREAHSEFDIFKFYANYNAQSQIPYLKFPVLFNIAFDSQMSQQVLNGNDRFSVGGIYSVRGFKDGSISSDSGYNIKNEISVNLGQAILPYLNLQDSPSYLGYLHYFTLTPFYDYGFVRAKGGFESGRLSGGGIKTSFNHQKIRASLTLSYAISKSQMLLQHHNETRAIFFEIGTDFSFF